MRIRKIISARLKKIAAWIDDGITGQDIDDYFEKISKSKHWVEASADGTKYKKLYFPAAGGKK